MHNMSAISDCDHIDFNGEPVVCQQHGIELKLFQFWNSSPSTHY